MLDQLITPLSNPVIIAGYSYTILNTLKTGGEEWVILTK